MSPPKKPNRRRRVAAGLLALSGVALLSGYALFRGSPPGGDGRRGKPLVGHTLPVQALAFSPDGAALVSVGCYLGSDERGMEIVIWDVGTGNLVEKRLEFTNGLRSLTLAPDGRRLAATVGDRDVVLWDVSPWRERARLALPGLYGHTIALSDDASRLATTNFQSGITVLGVKKGRTQSTCPVGGVISLAFAPGGSLLACGDRDATIWLWDPATGTECGVLRGYERPVFSLSFSPDGRLLAGGDYSGAVKVWDVATKALSVTLTAAVGLCEVEAVAFSPDGRTLAVAVERTVQLWDVAKGTRVAHLEGHQGKVKCLAFSPDGTRLASGSYDRTVRLWDMARFRSTGP